MIYDIQFYLRVYQSSNNNQRLPVTSVTEMDEYSQDQRGNPVLLPVQVSKSRMSIIILEGFTRLARRPGIVGD